MTPSEEISVSLDDLLLDPNNYRFQDGANFQLASPDRYHERSVQQHAFERIKKVGIDELKGSIGHNGFLTFERMIVRPYLGGHSKYVVVEGNRRVAALKSLKGDHDAGISTRADVLQVFASVPVLNIPSDDPTIYLSMMGIRHVGGVKQWGPYQSSKLVSELRDQHSLEFSEIGARLSMQTREVTRRYRAYKALRQMEEDEEFSEYCERRMYPMFHEAVSQPAIRDWLKWDETTSEFKNEETLRQFYELISPRQSDDGKEVPPKISLANEVRDLKTVLGSPEAKAVLMDPARTFAETLSVTKAEELKHSWTVQVSKASKALAGIPALDLRELTADQEEVLRDLGRTLNAVLESYARMTEE